MSALPQESEKEQVKGAEVITSILSSDERKLILNEQELEEEEPAISIWAKLLRKLQVPHDGKPISVLRNPDLEPIADNERTWGFWSYFAFWGLPNFGAPSLSFGSAILSLGLNIKQAIGALVICNVLISLFTIANSNPGIKYHIGYTIDQRMIFGIYGSFFGIIVRVGLSVVQYASAAWLGGLYMNMIFSAFSKNYLYMKNTFPESVPMSRRDCIGFLCFQVIQMPLAWLKPRHSNIPSIVTCCMSGLAVVGMLAYLVNINGGPGPMWYEKVTLSTSQRCWMWIYSITIWYSGVSAAVVNQSDFSRFAKNEWSCYLGMVAGCTIPGTFVPFAGMLYASTCQKLYGKAYWRPDEIIGQWFEDEYNAKARAASFFIGLSFASCQVFMNMMQNGYPCGMDLAGIFPKYINISRGTLFMQLLSWVVQPWIFYNTTSQFLNATSSFGMFTTPIVTINVLEFYWYRKRRLPLIDFYSLSPRGAYWYYHGINWRPFFPVLVSVALCVPGLFYSVNANTNPNAGMNHFYFGYVFFIPLMSAGLYIITCYFFPDKHERKATDDPVDYFHCFNDKERKLMGMLPYTESETEIFEFLEDQERGQSSDSQSGSLSSGEVHKHVKEINS
ncbi:related to Nicotinamide riboside transporter 1 [Zygosaccharomyces bailii]|nr:related to Nicotinamide riboside transporter 1 [Zygosaccharomyces bailii]